MALVAHSATETRAETIRVARAAAPASLGNPFTSVGQPSSGVWSALFDGLTRIGETGEVEPALAESWELIDPNTWVFNLRKNVVFHNGRPVTADAVKAIVEYLQSENGRALYVASEVTGIKQTIVRDSHTLEFITESPDAILPKRLTLVAVPEPDAWSRLGQDGFGLTPVGTGPFRLESWGANSDRIEMSAFASSWRAPKRVSKLELLTVSDTTARQQALVTGAVDLVEGVSIEDVTYLESNGFNIHKSEAGQVASIAFRTVENDSTPLNDRRVRQALNYAVNKRLIAQALFGDASLAARQGATPLTFGFAPDVEPFTYDPERARALLAKAGYADGFAIEAEVLTGFTSVDSLMYQQAAQDLAEVGVSMELRTPPFATWVRKYVSGDWGDVDAFSFVWDSSAYFDVIRPMRNFSCLKVNPFFCDESVAPLIEASNQILDVDKRRKALQLIMQRMRDNPSAIWLVALPVRVASRADIHTVRLRPTGIVYEALPE